MSEKLTDKKIKPELTKKIRQYNIRQFHAVCVKAAINKMTKTTGEKHTGTISLTALCIVLRLQFITEVNKHYSKTDFFAIFREPGESV